MSNFQGLKPSAFNLGSSLHHPTWDEPVVLFQGPRAGEVARVAVAPGDGAAARDKALGGKMRPQFTRRPKPLIRVACAGHEQQTKRQGGGQHTIVSSLRLVITCIMFVIEIAAECLVIMCH